MNFAHCPAERGQLGEVFHPSGRNTSALAHCPCHIQATYTTPTAESLGHELHFASQGCGVDLLLLLWKDKWKMEFFKHLVLWLLLILGQGGGSLLYGAGTQGKLCVLHTQVALTMLLRQKELWMLCLSPSKAFGDEACALQSVFQQSSRAGSSVLG